ncbi:MAG: DUF2974 domain-containing protein [Clostridia bacterium]|nr:DUF2974 domain-containing protein [Clostridia bacterium]
MANMLDYLDWRGDIPFSVSPFNEVDNLIFSQLSFIDLEGILPARVSSGSMPLHEAAERYFMAHPDDNESMGLIVPAAIRTLIQRLATCERYRNLLLAGYVSIIDESIQKQFAALTIQIDERQLYVAYRGTDDTLVGWKENFNMSFMQAIPAQLDAVAYLNHVAADTTHPHIYVGGHSKGGNLAIYAAIHCESAIKPRIVRVYSNDGPGYHREVIDSQEYRTMADRVVNIVPQTSVIGRLLEHDECYTVVQSSATGLWQHDGFSWEIKGTQFVQAPALTAESERIERSVKKWIADMDEGQRQAFVEAFYRVLTSTNAKTLTDLTRDRNWFWQLMTNSELSESRKTVMAGLSQLTGEAGRLWIDELKTKKAENSEHKQGRESSKKLATKVKKPIVASSGAKSVVKKPSSNPAASPKKTPQQVIKDILETAEKKSKTMPKRQTLNKTAAKSQANSPSKKPNQE